MLYEIRFAPTTVEVCCSFYRGPLKWGPVMNDSGLPGDEFQAIGKIIRDPITTNIHRYLVRGPVVELADITTNLGVWDRLPDSRAVIVKHSTKPGDLILKGQGRNPYLDGVTLLGKIINESARSITDVYIPDFGGEHNVKANPNYFGKVLANVGHECQYVGPHWDPNPFWLHFFSDGSVVSDGGFDLGCNLGEINNLLDRESQTLEHAYGHTKVTDISLSREPFGADAKHWRVNIDYRLEQQFSMWSSPVVTKHKFNVRITFEFFSQDLAVEGLPDRGTPYQEFYYDMPPGWVYHRLHAWDGWSGDFRNITAVKYSRTWTDSWRRSKYPPATPGIGPGWQSTSGPADTLFEYNTWGTVTAFSKVGAATDSVNVSFDSFRRRDLKTGRYTFRDWQFSSYDTDRLFNHCLPALQFSTADAFNKGDVAINNRIETIMELDSLFAFLDLAKLAVQVKTSMKKGEPIQALRYFASTLGSAELMWIFGYSGTLEEAQWAYDNNFDVIKSFRDFAGRNKPIEVRGTYSRLMPKTNAFPFVFRLDARTKVKLALGPSSLAALLIAMDRQGALATPGTIWDLIQWSVFMDWFWPSGTYLKTASTIMTNQLFDLYYYVHSLRVDVDITSDMLPEGITPVDAKARLYRRFVLPNLPGFGMNSDYDFASAPGISKKILGALVLAQMAPRGVKPNIYGHKL